MRSNRLVESWREGRAVTNAWLTLGNAAAAEIMAHQGWDSLTVDMQHGYSDFASVLSALTAISTTEVVPLVRVPWNEPGTVMRVLDAGAYGVICPNIDTRADCERFVGACRYAPLGYRSVGPRRAVLYAGADYIAKANETLLAIVQIELATALGNVDEIAAIPGLDMLYVGPADLALSLGIAPRGDPTDPTVVAAIDRISRRGETRQAVQRHLLPFRRIRAGHDRQGIRSRHRRLGRGAARLRHGARRKLPQVTLYAAQNHPLYSAVQQS